MAITQDDRILRLSTPLAYNFLLITSLRFSEGLSELFHGELEIVHEEEKEGFKPTPVDPKELIGKPMNITVEQRDQAKRYFDGICVSFSRSGRGSRFSRYKAVIVPKVWTLTQSRQSRIFQNLSVPEVLKKVLDGYEVDYEIQGTFEPRNYCVQYRESDWDFASRLMEEEGIYYYFKHTEDSHRLLIANTPQSHKPCPAKAELPWEVDVSENKEDWMGGVHAFEYQDRLRTGKTELWDYHFQIQDNNLMATQTSIFDIGKNKDLEVYDFPGGYAKRFDGIDQGGGDQDSQLQKVFEDRERTVKIRQEEFDVDYRSIFMVSSSCAPTSGHRFKLTKHPNGEYNIDYVLVSLVHEVFQTPDYNTGEELKNAYTVTMACLPHGSGQAPYRPPQKTPKPIVYGSQTAIVTGPAGEEIFVDKYGRVKVQFHWDRHGKADASSSCWLRVGTSIAGNKWGTMFIPRIGQEVIVDFLEGDPDQPIIVGEVYNPKHMPHYELPKYKTLSYIKTRTSPDNGKGFNELRFEDKQGKEQVFVHSEKRMDVRVKESLYETCGGNRQEVIGMRSDDKPGGNLATSVGGNFDLHVKGDHFITIDKGLYEGVKGDVAQEYKGKQQTVVTGSRELNAQSITLEAKTSITLKVGGNFVVIDQTGVTIQGNIVRINSGGMAMPTLPMKFSDAEDAEWSDNGEPGYLDKPRKAGTGGGRKWRTVNGQHAPDTHKLSTIMNDAKAAENKGDAAEAAKKKQEAIDEAIKVYNIDTSKTKDVKYDPTVSGEGSTTSDGHVRIGDDAFQDPAWLGSSIGHEAETHTNEQGDKGKWYTGPEGTAVQECQAYDYEIANAERYGTSPDQVAELKKRRQAYHDQLSDEYKNRVDGNPPNYDMKPGDENR